MPARLGRRSASQGRRCRSVSPGAAAAAAAVGALAKELGAALL